MCICVCGGISVTILFPRYFSSSVDYQQIIKRKQQGGRSINEFPTFMFSTRVQINDLINALSNENRETLDYYNCRCSIQSVDLTKRRHRKKNERGREGKIRFCSKCSFFFFFIRSYNQFDYTADDHLYMSLNNSYTLKIFTLFYL